MRQPAKILAWLLATIVALFVLAAVAFVLFFDPNDFREEIAAKVKESTGRELVIDGDISLSFFPWLAVEVGSSSMGNAPGFGDQPFAAFDRAKMGVQLLPLLFGQEVAVGSVEVDGLALNLQVNKRGANNWSGLVRADKAPSEKTDAPADAAVDVVGINFRNANVSYTDAGSGGRYALSNADLRIGPASGSAQNLVVDGFLLEGTVEGIGAIPSELRLAADTIGIEPEVGVSFSDVQVTFDDTTLRGELGVPFGSGGKYEFDFDADQIDLARYMVPAGEVTDSEAAAAAPLEIPVELIRPLNARGKLRLAMASLGNIVFANVVVGLDAGGGRLRLHPISSGLFGGTYSGDVSIDVSGRTPVLSVDEKIEGVDLGDLAEAMFGKDNITGGINGAFKLSGRGSDMAKVQQSLSGNMSFQLDEGSYEGTDIWYELRRARALIKGEAAPEPELPPRTRFSSITATGVVQNGVMRNDDLYAELPYLQMRGRGNVNLVAATLDYDLEARVLERPESLDGVTAEELDDFTEAVIPLKISGALASPSVKPDVERLLRKRVEDEIKDKLFDRLLGGDKEPEPAAAEGDAPTEEPSGEEQPKDVEDEIKDELEDKLKDIFKR